MRIRQGVAVGLAAIGLAALGPVATPVSAHSGGKAVVLVADLTLTPSGNSWTANTTLVDGDSGSPIRGAAVKAMLGTPAKAHDLEPGSTLGNYTGTLGALPAGPTHLELQVRTLPGSEPVVPYTNAWDFELTAGQPVTVARETAGGGGSKIALILSVAGAVILLALIYGLFSLRRRTAGPRIER
ncbi:hypothetical protein [Sporichthya polymorpha]|uniref:hypothetical protein n=1 Tax=Sporichthya polymorpha TaxID=35751 RepID=UPI000379870A|nr:hypothetical protein [Sporichthya polymorpha]